MGKNPHLHVAESSIDSHLFGYGNYRHLWGEVGRRCPDSRTASRPELELLGDQSGFLPLAGCSPRGRHLLPHKLTLTCDSVIPSEYASRALSGPAKYLVCSKVFSRAKIWCPVKVGRVCFFLWMLSLRGSGAGGRKKVCG